jgi:LacI family transcriptional regulator
VTIYDIATEAKVSISTVSRVLNSPHKVGAPTRLHVESIIKKHNYSPNAMARGLVHNSMKTVGVLTSDIRNLHFSTAVTVLENLFFKQGYSTLLCNTSDDLDKKKKYIRFFAERKIDGLILLGSVFNNKEIERMICDYLPKTPVVISNSTLSVPNAYSVLIDHSVGMDLSVSHLVQRNHKNIAFVHTHETYNAKRKIVGFLEAIERYDLPVNEDKNLYFTNPFITGGEEFGTWYLASGNKPRYSAFIFAEDSIAIGAVNVFTRAGLHIPQDVAIIGHDNSVFSQCSLPKLTSVDTKIKAISEVMANTLHDVFQKKIVGQSITLRPNLVVREST